MTPIELVDALVEFIKVAAKDYDLSTKIDGVTKMPDVHAGYLPPKEKNNDDKAIFPYIIVQYDSGHDDQDNQAKIRIIIGTYSEDEQNGWRDALNVANRLHIALRKSPLLGPFSLVGPIKPKLFPEQFCPEWLAMIEVSYNLPQVQFEWSDELYD